MFGEIIAAGHQAAGFVELASAGVYAGLVALGYATEGPEYHFRFDLRKPVRSTERLLVGLGVRLMGAIVRLAKSALENLFEASAEIGEWFVRRNPSVQERVRSRFL
jgi:hypothetical protein